MKITKILFILMLTLCALSSNAIPIPNPEEEDIDYELEKRKALEKTRMKSLTEITALSTLKKLLAEPSREEREQVLNKLPIEMQEYLIPTIDNRISLLDTSIVDEAEQAKKLQELKEELTEEIFIKQLFVE